MIIQIGSALSRALGKIKDNIDGYVQTKEGLYVPPAYIKGLHYGGFDGYEPWVQDCVRVALEGAKDVGPDEVAEITAVVLWNGPGDTIPSYAKHNVATKMIDDFCCRVAEEGKADEAMSAAAQLHQSRAQGTRQNGTLLVCAINGRDVFDNGKLNFSYSTWKVSTKEEADAIPRREYALG